MIRATSIVVLALAVSVFAGSRYHRGPMRVAQDVVVISTSDPLKVIWQTVSPNTSITFPTRSGYTYSATLDWGDGSVSNLTGHNVGNVHVYASTGVYTSSLAGTVGAIYLNAGTSYERLRGVASWGSVNNAALGLENAFFLAVNATDWPVAVSSSWANVTSLKNTWRYCSTATNFPDISALVNVTSLEDTWRDCSTATNFPIVTNLTKVTSLQETWQLCKLLRDASDISTLTNVTTMAGAWNGCEKLTNLASVSAQTKNTSLNATWQDCRIATIFPEVNAQTNVTDLGSAWNNCYTAKNFPAVNALTKNTSLSTTWYLCSNGTNFPDVSSHYLNTSLFYTWNGCVSNTTAYSLALMTNVIRADLAFYNNIRLTNMPAFPAASTKLANVSQMFYNCTNVTGTAPALWNTTNFPNLSTYSQCFYNCSNLSNYADIPVGWK